MELIVNSADRKVFGEIKKETISGLAFSLFPSVDALSHVNIHELDSHNITLTRCLDGQKIEEILNLSIYQLYSLAFAGRSSYANSAIFTPLSYLANPSYSFKFSFGTNYVLKDGEYFELECTNTTFSGDAFSYTVETIPSIGLQTFKPVFDVYNLDSAKTKYDLNLGNDVQRVVFLQRQLPSAVTAVLQAPVNKMRVKADKIDAEFSKEAIYTANVDFHGSSSNSGCPINLLSTGVLLNDVKLVLECANASPARQLIVVRAVQTPEIVNKFQAKTRQHHQENIAHVKANDSL